MEGDEAHQPVLKKPTPCRPKAVRLVNTKSSPSDQDYENTAAAAASVAAATSSQQENSFSDLLATAIRSPSSPSPTSSSSTCLFRPKTIRLRPHPITFPHNDARTATSNPATAAAGQSSEFNRSNLIFRPVAKLAKRVYFPSSNAGLSNLHPQNRIRLPAPASAYVLGTSSSCPPAAAASSEQKPTTEADANNKEAAIDETQRSSVDQKASCDGYNWRKYGQKQVKGSEYPRSYYKCTHPTCPVKKKVERSLEGQVTEIVYKGEHNHSKPQSTRRPLPAAASSDSFTALANTIHSLSSTDYLPGSLHSNPQHLLQPAGFHHESLTNFSDMSKSLNPIQDDGDINQNLDDPLSKRRKKDKAPDVDHAYKPNSSSILEPRVVVQTSDADIMEDGFRWRKYGQKVVKGNPYPRSYYKCTSLECSVRKHVERISDDPRSFVTTYEGKHNHDPPQARISNIGSNNIHVAGEAETNFSNRHTLMQDIVASSNRDTEEPGLHMDDTIPNLQ